MSNYSWRTMSDQQRKLTLRHRVNMSWPWHGPPHVTRPGVKRQLLTGACFEHRHIIGQSPDRMDGFCRELLAALASVCPEIHAFCVLPNHYHVLASIEQLEPVFAALGLLHGRNSHQWNSEDGTRGRKVFHRATNRYMRSDRHFWASLNYVHHNPVHHGYARKWQDWPWSSARAFLAERGKVEADRLWHAFPVLDFGRTWDSAEL